MEEQQLEEQHHYHEYRKVVSGRLRTVPPTGPIITGLAPVEPERCDRPIAGFKLHCNWIGEESKITNHIIIAYTFAGWNSKSSPEIKMLTIK